MTRNGDLDDHSSVNVDDSRSKIVLRLGKSTGTGPYDTIITDDTIISDATPVNRVRPRITITPPPPTPPLPPVPAPDPVNDDPGCPRMPPQLVCSRGSRCLVHVVIFDQYHYNRYQFYKYKEAEAEYRKKRDNRDDDDNDL